VLNLDGLPAGGLQNHRGGLDWQSWRCDIGRPVASVDVLVVAESGERRSTCDRTLSAALREWERDRARAAAPAQAAYASAAAALQAKHDGLREAIRRKRHDGHDTAEDEAALNALVQDAPPPKPVPRLLHADATPEALRGFPERAGTLPRGSGFMVRSLIAWPESTQARATTGRCRHRCRRSSASGCASVSCWRCRWPRTSTPACSRRSLRCRHRRAPPG